MEAVAELQVRNRPWAWLAEILVEAVPSETLREIALKRKRVHGRFASGAVGGLQSRLTGMFTAAEKASGRAHRQPSAELDPLYKQAEELHGQFRNVLEGGVAKELGAKTHYIGDEASYARTQEGVSSAMSKPHVVVAATKGRDRAEEKVQNKYGGDAGRLTDLTRGSILVPHVDHVPDAVRTLRKHAERNGWKIVAPENRFSHEDGSPVHTGVLASGYRDASVLLKHRSGHLAEVQIHTNPIWHAKEIGEPGGNGVSGHHIYEDERKITEKHGKSLPPAEHARVKELQETGRRLYHNALADSVPHPR